MQMLRSLSDQVEIIIVINASDIEKNKVRSDLGITYDQDVLRLIDIFRASPTVWRPWASSAITTTPSPATPPTPSSS